MIPLAREDHAKARFLTVAEVASLLRVSNMTVYRLISAGDLPAVRVGKSYRLREDDVDKYLGSSPTFVLDPPLRVKKTNWIAITVPTWAPIFANNLTSADWWRASRPKGSCEPPKSLEPFALQVLRRVSVFGCTYHGARLMYSATYVPDPKETSESDSN